MRKRVHIAVGLGGLAAAGVVAAIAGAADSGMSREMLAAGVTYSWQPCSGAPDRAGAPRPVTAGTLELSRGGRTIRVSLLAGGTQPTGISLPGQGPVSATLVLQTPRVRITGPRGGTAERIGLHKRAAVNGHLSFTVGADEERNGHVNTLIQLQHAARVAAATAPRQLPLVQAHVYDGPPASRPDIHFDSPTTINVGQAQGLDAQWEPTALIHEYGHFVLHTLGAEGPDGGEHDSRKSYPQKPTLAWNEGFSNAFAAVVLGNPVLLLGCERIAGLADQPAGPPLASAEDKRYAQYSQTRVGGATYQLIGHLGGGQAGLKRLLSALPAYRRAGHSVWTARDLRDLAAQTFEHSPADHVAIDKIFGGQRISWYRYFGVAADLAALGQSGGQFMKPELALHVTGPGGFDCHTTVDIQPFDPATRSAKRDNGTPLFGVKKADGGLSFAADDDCYLVSGDGRVSGAVEELSPLADAATMPFPYLSGLAHWNGDFTVRAKYVCALAAIPPTPGITPICPPSMKVDMTVSSSNEDPAVPRMYKSIVLNRNTDQTVATFRANGECQVFAPAGDRDCSL
jgi:hypothetical protein